MYNTLIYLLIILNSILLFVFSPSAFADSSKETSECSTVKFNKSDIGIAIIAGRDTGPVTRMDGSGLIVSMDIFTLERQQLPETIEIPQAWAYLNSEEWDMNTSKAISTFRYFDGTGFSFTFRQGPPWPVGSTLNIKMSLQINDWTCELSQRAVQIMKNR